MCNSCSLGTILPYNTTSLHGKVLHIQYIFHSGDFKCVIQRKNVDLYSCEVNLIFIAMLASRITCLQEVDGGLRMLCDVLSGIYAKLFSECINLWQLSTSAYCFANECCK